MNRKIEIGIGIAGIVIGLIAWLFPVSSLQTKGDTLLFEPIYKALVPDPTLTVSGTGARVEILLGPDGGSFAGGEVSDVGAETSIYIPHGQKIKLKLTGTGAKVFVQPTLMPYIEISNIATGGAIYEL